MTAAERRGILAHLNAVVIACSTDAALWNDVLDRTNDAIEALYAVPCAPDEVNEAQQ